MANQKEIEIIEGEVTQAYPPSKNDDTGKWRPANIYIETEEGMASISQFAKGDYDTGITYEPIQMPAWYTALDLDSLPGAKVQVAAAYKSTYNETRQYVNVQTFKVVSDLPKPKPTQANNAPSSWSNSVDERIAWNSSINNAVHAHPFLENPVKNDPLDSAAVSHWIDEVDALASPLYGLIRRGPVAEDTVPDNHEEPEDELFPDDGVQSI